EPDDAPRGVVLDRPYELDDRAVRQRVVSDAVVVRVVVGLGGAGADGVRAAERPVGGAAGRAEQGARLAVAGAVAGERHRHGGPARGGAGVEAAAGRRQEKRRRVDEQVLRARAAAEGDVVELGEGGGGGGGGADLHA